LENQLAKATKQEPALQFSTQEQGFLHHFFDSSSETKGNPQESARRAGYSERSLAKAARRILQRYENAMLSGALTAVGVSKMSLALRLKAILEDKGAKDKDVLLAIKLCATALGEKVDGASTAVNVNVASPKSLVVIGMGDDVNEMLTGKKDKQLPAPKEE
jgi:hypothetical protein